MVFAMSDGYERLGALDKTFLDLERPNEPQHIAAITVFEEIIRNVVVILHRAHPILRKTGRSQPPLCR